MYRILCIPISEYLYIRHDVDFFDELYNAVYLPEEFIQLEQYKILEFNTESHAKRTLSKITDGVYMNNEWIAVKNNILLFEVVKC